jgi:hypothetical protein
VSRNTADHAAIGRPIRRLVCGEYGSDSPWRFRPLEADGYDPPHNHVESQEEPLPPVSPHPLRLDCLATTSFDIL